MGRASPRGIHRYSLEFKRQAVKLSQLDGVEVQAVADALDIHPFMLSRWRKEMRDGQLRGMRGEAPGKPPRCGSSSMFKRARIAFKCRLGVRVGHASKGRYCPISRCR